MAPSIGSHRKVRWKSVLDFLAVAGPVICLIDCVVLPVASALLPFLGMTEFGHCINDQQLFLLVIAICGPIIIPGYLKHRNNRVLALFAIAIGMMFIVNFVDLIADETAHAVISLTAACLLIKANRDNKKLLSCACSMHDHGSSHNPPATQATEAFNHLVSTHNEHIHSDACGTSGAHVHSHLSIDNERESNLDSVQTIGAHGLQGHQPDHDHSACLHQVVVALELKDHGLDPDHFEPKNNLNFEPACCSPAPSSVAPAGQPVICCG
jgi:hypothetical protein